MKWQLRAPTSWAITCLPVCCDRGASPIGNERRAAPNTQDSYVALRFVREVDDGKPAWELIVERLGSADRPPPQSWRAVLNPGPQVIGDSRALSFGELVEVGFCVGDDDDAPCHADWRRLRFR